MEMPRTFTSAGSLISSMFAFRGEVMRNFRERPVAPGESLMSVALGGSIGSGSAGWIRTLR
jgi:hypothetical protein